MQPTEQHTRTFEARISNRENLSNWRKKENVLSNVKFSGSSYHGRVRPASTKKSVTQYQLDVWLKKTEAKRCWPGRKFMSWKQIHRVNWEGKEFGTNLEERSWHFVKNANCNRKQQPPRSEWGMVRSDLLRIKTKDRPSDLPSTCVREIRRQRAWEKNENDL